MPSFFEWSERSEESGLDGMWTVRIIKKNILSLQFLRANGESGTGGDGHEGKSVARDVPSPPPVPSPSTPSVHYGHSLWMKEALGDRNEWWVEGDKDNIISSSLVRVVPWARTVRPVKKIMMRKESKKSLIPISYAPQGSDERSEKRQEGHEVGRDFMGL